MIAVWFRRDLRLLDQPALYHACELASQSGQRLTAFYVATPRTWKKHSLAPRQADLIQRRLRWLQKSLQKHGVLLQILNTDTYEQIPQLLEKWCRHKGVTHIFSNRQYEIDEVRRDEAVRDRLSHIMWQQFDDKCLVAPGRVRNLSGEMYKVFTPFSKKWCQVLQNEAITPLPSLLTVIRQDLTDALPETTYFEFDYATFDSTCWPVEDSAILECLEYFMNHKMEAYPEARDRPDIDGVSGMSPYLAIGAVSARQCLAVLMEKTPDVLFDRSSPAFSWLNELAWRDFYQHLVAEYPHLCMGRAFKPDTEDVAWRYDDKDFDAWCEGNTGYPIVDAAMKQLKQTGWMHNRLRMIVASFLTKDLFIDWRWGERYFMEHLIDGDFASNNGGWQWSASTGTDSQPYFRVFNPVSQGQRFDPEGKYVSRWIPELGQVPEKYIHQPYQWARSNEIKLTYPKPVVDHKFARERAIASFRCLREVHEMGVSDASEGNKVREF